MVRWKKPASRRARQQFETNLFGVLRVTNAILPECGQQGDGRIVNISSVLGFLPAPYWGIYARANMQSKDIPRHWTTRSGDSVCARCWSTRLHKTKLNGNTKSAKNHSRGLRGGTKALTDATQQNIERGDDPRMVAEAVWNALTAKSPRLRYPVGKGVALSRLAPLRSRRHVRQEFSQAISTGRTCKHTSHGASNGPSDVDDHRSACRRADRSLAWRAGLPNRP
jgi:hypothetical protein